jgi:hypothetical protein
MQTFIPGGFSRKLLMFYADLSALDASKLYCYDLKQAVLLTGLSVRFSDDFIRDSGGSRGPPRSRPPWLDAKIFFTCSHTVQICSPGPHYIKFKISQD